MYNFCLIYDILFKVSSSEHSYWAWNPKKAPLKSFAGFISAMLSSHMEEGRPVPTSSQRLEKISPAKKAASALELKVLII